MRTKFLIGAVAFGLVITDPAICAQTAPTPPDGSQTVPGEVEDPANPNPMPDPPNPMPPVTEPLPPEMPMQEQMPMQPAPVVIDRSLPSGTPATPPTAGANSAVSGSTTMAMMQPVPATKTYPLCTRTLQDNCTNPGRK